MSPASSFIELSNQAPRIVCTSKIGNLSEQVGYPRRWGLDVVISRFFGVGLSSLDTRGYNTGRSTSQRS